MKKNLEEIRSIYEAFSKNANDQLEKGNKAAGVRARKAALDLIKNLKEFRKISVEESKN